MVFTTVSTIFACNASFIWVLQTIFLTRTCVYHGTFTLYNIYNSSLKKLRWKSPSLPKTKAQILPFKNLESIFTFYFRLLTGRISPFFWWGKDWIFGGDFQFLGQCERPACYRYPGYMALVYCSPLLSEEIYDFCSWYTKCWGASRTYNIGENIERSVLMCLLFFSNDIVYCFWNSCIVEIFNRKIYIQFYDFLTSMFSSHLVMESYSLFYRWLLSDIDSCYVITSCVILQRRITTKGIGKKFYISI